jgi:hypothetical protein
MEAYAIFILGLTFGIAGLLFLFFRARKTDPNEIMLGTGMTVVGWTLALIGGIWVLVIRYTAP